MKKLFIIIFLLLTLIACAQTKTIIGPTVTVAWDAPALGTIPAAEVSYEVWVQPYPSGAAILVATLAAVEQAVTFSVEGAYRIGVRTKRIVATDGTILYSAYSWGDVEGSPAPWYVAYYATPPRVLKVRLK
jgi:hypothetical protein